MIITISFDIPSIQIKVTSNEILGSNFLARLISLSLKLNSKLILDNPKTLIYHLQPRRSMSVSLEKSPTWLRIAQIVLGDSLTPTIRNSSSHKLG